MLNVRSLILATAVLVLVNFIQQVGNDAADIARALTHGVKHKVEQAFEIPPPPDNTEVASLGKPPVPR